MGWEKRKGGGRYYTRSRRVRGRVRREYVPLDIAHIVAELDAEERLEREYQRELKREQEAAEEAARATSTRCGTRNSSTMSNCPSPSCRRSSSATRAPRTW